MNTLMGRQHQGGAWGHETTRAGEDTMIVERERTRALGHDLLLDLLNRSIADERDGAALYRRYLDDAPAEMYDTLVASGAQIDQHVRLLERVMTQLGGDPSFLPPAAEHGRLTGEPGAPRDTRASRWIARLDAIVAFETRDQTLWTTLYRLSRHSLAAADAAIVRPAALQVESAEAFGACNGSRHRERIRWARDTMRDLARQQRGLGPPRYRPWRALAGFVWAG